MATFARTRIRTLGESVLGVCCLVRQNTAMDLGIRNRVAMVAAGSKGIGRACAKALSEEGCLVSICGRNEESLAEACLEIGGTVRGYRADVSMESDLTRWFEATTSELGPPDIVITNTGGPPAGTFDQMTDDQWQAGIDSTLLNVVRIVRLVGPGMQERKWGRILHITSLVAKEPNPMLPISSAIRSGLMALTRLQATHFAPYGVTVNGVLPGHTKTDRQTHLASITASKLNISVEEALARRANEVPMLRLAEPEEIAAAAVFLCSERAAYITGVNLLVDGGITKGIA